MQPEGNLFRDRFLSLQQRGLVEPRALVVYVFSPFILALKDLTNALSRARQRQAKTKEYEKHAWKRFE